MKKILLFLAIISSFLSFSLEKFDIKLSSEIGYNYDKSYKIGAETLIYTKDSYISNDVYFKTGIGLTSGVNLNNVDSTKVKLYLGPVVSAEVGKEILNNFKVYGNLQGSLPFEFEIKDKKLIIGPKASLTLSSGIQYSIINAEIGIGYPGIIGRLGIIF